MDITKNSVRKRVSFVVISVLVLSMCFSQIMPMTTEAAKKKPAVKSLELKINGKKVNGKTITVKKGSSLKVSVKVNPSKAKKSVTYKTSNKKVATVSKGKIKAKKAGTTRISVKVRGRNGKTKSAVFSVKVVNTLPKPSAPSKPVVTPPVVKPEDPKPVDPTPEEPKEDPTTPTTPSGKADPTATRYDLLNNLDYSEPWMSCSHKWHICNGASETRTTCNYCAKDLGNTSATFITHAKSGISNGCKSHGGYNNGMNDFYVCTECGACWKHTQDYNNPTDVEAGINRIYSSYSEARKSDNPDVTVMMNGYAYNNSADHTIVGYLNPGQY